ncbi:5510_t:CDS:1, partial [Cetraspora pellucida]
YSETESFIKPEFKMILVQNEIIDADTPELPLYQNPDKLARTNL